MARSKARILRTLVLAALVVGGGVWAWRASRTPAPVTFRTARVDRGTVEATVTATGALNAVVTVQVGSQVSGTISKLGADFNSRVKEGQVIAQIDPTRFKANLDQAVASEKLAEAALAHAQVAVRQAKVELDRTRELAQRQVVGAADLDAAKTKYDSAVADVAASEAQLGQARASVGVARVDYEHTTIRAPISGVVLQRAVDVGQTVAASLQAPVLFTIAQDLEKMEVHAAVDEADVGKLKEGQEATFAVDAYPGETFKGTIFQIRSQPTVTQNVVTYDAVLRVANLDGKLRPGMTATVRAVAQRHDGVLRVPSAALRFRPAPELVEKQPGAPGQGQAGAPAGGPVAAQGGERRGGGERGPRGGGGGGGGGGKGSRDGQGRWTKVYAPKGNQVAAVRFKPGIADDEFTEVLSGDVHEGDEVVLDATGGPQASSPASSSSTRGRGPRFF